MRIFWKNKIGFSLIELVVATGLILLLTVMVVPMIEITSQREKEENLRSTLVEMRGALDLYHQEHSVYPASIGTLLTEKRPDGYGFYLRRFPLNPLVASPEWEIASRTYLGGSGVTSWPRCISPDDTISFQAPETEPPPIVDIRCPDYGKGINNIPYKDW